MEPGVSWRTAPEEVSWTRTGSPVPGTAGMNGEGQDFTFNWMMRGGIEHVIAHHHRIRVGIMYQHMSNGGQTKPNPGIDALGFMVGYTWTQ